jgi:NAD(P)-dependent dehydrogenase (short-subunit alcohol dehydrogenase family)
LKNYLIIGASTGIGNTLANMLYQEPETNVFGTYLKTEISFTDHFYFQQYNVLEDELLVGLPEYLDGLVYCPGSIDLRPFTVFKEEDFINDYKLQVVGATKVIKQVLPLLKKSENASIVMFSTVAVNQGFPFHSLVSSSKGAIEGLTRALSAEFAPKIRVNCIAPSLTNTPLASFLLNTPEKIANHGQKNPLKRIGQAEDIAQCARFLLSKDSSWVTGQIMHVDGGMSSIKL